MSFSKAKILRFNDVKPCGPSPSKYNIVVKSKPKCAVIPQGERFTDVQSPTTSESGSVAGSTKSVPTGPFKTPTLIKKKKLIGSASKVINPKDLFSKLTKSSEQEALREKIIECENKTQCIQELSQDIEELKGELSKIKSQKEQLTIDREQYEKKIEDLIETHKKGMSELEYKFETTVNDLENEKMEVKEELNRIKQEYCQLREENQKDLAALSENCEKLEKIYTESVEDCRCLLQEKQNQIENQEKKLQDLEQKYAKEIEKYKSEIDKLQREHQNEIQEIEFEMLKTMTELQKEKESSAFQLKQIEQKVKQDITELKEKHDSEKQLIISEYEEKIKSFSDSNTRAEEIENVWKEKLIAQEKISEAILKECQAISEYNIIQSELEKNKIKADLDAKIFEYNELEKRYNPLLEKCEELKQTCLQFERQLQNTKQKFTKELEQKNKELTQKSTETKAYQITIHNLQGTIEVLKKRLINSDHDVEQLKLELTTCEKTILDLESKCLQLNSELKQAQMASDELEIQLESNVKLNENEVKKIHEELVNKVEFYKNQVVTYSEQIEEERSGKNEVMRQLSDAIAVVNKINHEVEVIKNKFEKEIEEYEEKLRSEDKKYIILDIHCNEIEQKCEDLVEERDYYKNRCDEYEEEMREMSMIRKKYIEQSGKYDDLLQQFEKLLLENDIMKEEKQRLSEENKTCRSKLEEQTSKLEKLEGLETQNETLQKQVLFLEDEVRNISEKYADIVGHQNAKQKIKHLVDIKAKNEELLQNKIDLELKLNNHIKVSEKLKKENADLRKCLKKYKIGAEDKENIGSPNRSSPFRERN